MNSKQAIFKGIVICIGICAVSGCSQKDSVRQTDPMYIFTVIQQRQEELVDSCLDKIHNSFKMEDDRGRTPLFWAVATGQVRVASSLLSRGARVDSIESETGYSRSARARLP